MSVHDRIQKLFQLSTSSNPHEAAAALAKAQELLARHYDDAPLPLTTWEELADWMEATKNLIATMQLMQETNRRTLEGLLAKHRVIMTPPKRRRAKKTQSGDGQEHR